MDEWMNGWMDVCTDSHCILQDFVSLWGPPPKNHDLNLILKKKHCIVVAHVPNFYLSARSSSIVSSLLWKTFSMCTLYHNLVNFDSMYQSRCTIHAAARVFLIMDRMTD